MRISDWSSDVGSSDLGYLFFTGRQAHWLRTHGESVSAYEVESVLSRFRGVEEVIVVGVPADLGEEDVKAFVRVAPGSDFDPESLLRWAAADLAAFKLPRSVEGIGSATCRERVGQY